MKKLARLLLRTPLFTHNIFYRWAYWNNIYDLIPKLISRPRRVIVENTNLCNLRCTFCPNDIMKREKGIMPNQMFYDIVNHCISLGIEHLYAFGIGEPLIDPHYIAKIKYAKECGIKDVHCVTNGLLLNRALTQELFDSRLDYLGISLNTLSRFDYYAYHRGGDFELVKKNIKRLKKLRKGNTPEIEIRLKDKKYWRQVKPYADKVDFYVNITNWGDKIKGNVLGGVKFACSDLWSSMYICQDGQVALCCKDYECSYKIGDINEDDLIDIWHGERMEEARKLHLRGRWNEIPICKNCDSNSHLVNPWWRVEL